MLFTVNFKNKLVYIPITFCCWMIFGLFTTFGIAASYGAISTPPEWPSISSTGAYPPTSCIFSMVLCWGAVVGFFCITYYYQYIRAAFHDKLNMKTNHSMLIMGICVCFGTAIVGCNQRPNIAILHALGAFMAFIIGAVYCGFATWQTWQIKQIYDEAYPMWFVILRLSLTVLESLSFILMMVFSAQRANSRSKATAGNAFEWCVVILQCLFYLTMIVEFSNLKHPNLSIKLTTEANRAIKRENVSNNNNFHATVSY